MQVNQASLIHREPFKTSSPLEGVLKIALGIIGAIGSLFIMGAGIANLPFTALIYIAGGLGFAASVGILVEGILDLKR